MSKKIIFSLVIVILSGLIYLNLLAYKSPQKATIISQAKVYSLLQNEEFNVYLYANKPTAYQKLDAIVDVNIHSSDNTKKLTATVKDIIKVGTYKYITDNYYCYCYTVILPKLTNYYYIEDAFFSINLKNGDFLTVKLGTFDYYFENSNLELTELFGLRDELPRLKMISFKFDLAADIFIKELYLSHNIAVSINKTVSSDQLIEVAIPPHVLISDLLAVKINYELNGQADSFVFPYYLYYETLENPLDYGILNNVYLLD